MPFHLLGAAVPGVDVCGPGLAEVPELVSSMAWAGVINAGIGQACVASHEALEKEL